MRITSSVEYASRLMVSLARSHGTAAVTGERLAIAENVPADYVNQLLWRLRRAGLVGSTRGVGGGYLLSRHPREITLGQVIRAVDGAVFEGVCGKYDAGEKDCRHQAQCGISAVWTGLVRTVEEYVDGITLERLAEESVPGRLGEDVIVT